MDLRFIKSIEGIHLTQDDQTILANIHKILGQTGITADDVIDCFSMYHSAVNRNKTLKQKQDIYMKILMFHTNEPTLKTFLAGKRKPTPKRKRKPKRKRTANRKRKSRKRTSRKS